MSGIYLLCLMFDFDSVSVPGWNDPPQFSHTSLDSHGIKKSKLNKRPHPSPHSGPPSNTMSSHAPPPISITTPSTQQNDETHTPSPSPSHNMSVHCNLSESYPPTSEDVGVTYSSGVEYYSRIIDRLDVLLEKYNSSMKVSDMGSM